jgi:hypothetical protein
MHTKFWSENFKGRDYSEDLDVDGKLISEPILRCCLRLETSESHNELYCYIKFGETLD